MVELKATDEGGSQGAVPRSGSFPSNRIAPDEVIGGDRNDRSYAEFRQETDCREPYGIPHMYLAGCKGIRASDAPETPLIAFVNSRSGGRQGEKIMRALNRSIGSTQVVRCSKCQE